MDGFDVQVMGFVAPALIEAWEIPGTGADTGARRRQPRHPGRRADLHDGRRQDRTPARAHRRDAVLLGDDAGHRAGHHRRATAGAAVHHRPRAGIDHSERHGAHRRIQPEAQAGHADDGGERGLHRWRRLWRLRLAGAHPSASAGSRCSTSAASSRSWSPPRCIFWLPESLQFLRRARPQARRGPPRGRADRSRAAAPDVDARRDRSAESAACRRFTCSTRAARR